MTKLPFTLLILAVAFCPRVGATPPNFVVILTDDQGWNGTSVQMDPGVPGSKSDFYQTPRLEQLAAAGMRFSNGYSSAPVCAPTRAAILTGKSPAQLQHSDLPHSVPGSPRWESWYEGYKLTAPAPVELDPGILTIPRIVKQSNPDYVTAHVGKWHLDVTSQAGPLDLGYDVAPDPPIPPDEIDPWGGFQLSNVAGSFMQDRVDQGQPFFMQVSYRGVHDPIRSRQSVRAKYEALPKGTTHSNVPYAAMTEDLDTAYGMVLDKIEQLGIADNTYVFFASDNGGFLGPGYTSNSPLLRGKGTIFEGGIRVPYIVKGPGIQAGSVSSVPVSTTDIFSTIADLAGYGPVPSDVEGGSLRPVLENGGLLPAGMDHLSRNFTSGGELYWHWPLPRSSPMSSVRDGDYKLNVAWGASGQTEAVALFNLAADIGETTNLSALMPAKVADLKAKLDNYLAAVDASFAFDVKQNVIINWEASAPGLDPTGWRSTIDLQYKGRETWNLGRGEQLPARQEVTPFQPGLPRQAFSFDGDDIMRRIFFQVGDDGPRRSAIHGTPDWNRSATLEFWVRLDSLSQEQVLFESGDGTAGISATLGDADGDGLKNDLRFRVLGLVGADTGSPGTLKDITATAKIDQIADPTQNFIHLVTVFNDDPTNRYGEIYVNGELVHRVEAALGSNESPQWDGYDGAGLGNIAGSGLGGNGGSGDLPFSGGFAGDFAKVRFYNYAVDGAAVADNYHSVLGPVRTGVFAASGNAEFPLRRPNNVSRGTQESTAVRIMQEREDTLNAPLPVDAIITTGVTFASAHQTTAGALPAGTEFNSYLFQFDPPGTAGGAASGSITFEGNILGILFTESSLAATDHLLGMIANYGTASERGLSLGPEGFLSVLPDLHTLFFNLTTTGNDMVQFRVLTTATDTLYEADFSRDGQVDDADLAIWKSAFGVNGTGDADRDGDTDGRDFLAWQRQFGSVNQSASQYTVPEPNSAWLLVGGIFLAGYDMRLRRRRARIASPSKCL